MTPTLRKLYHRRGKILSYLYEIDRQINELTPQKGDLVVYDYGSGVNIGYVFYRNSDGLVIFDGSGFIVESVDKHLTILEKGFER